MIKTIPALGSAGVIYDQLPQELPDSGLSSVSNVRFRNGAVERMRGEDSILTGVSQTAYGLFTYSTGSTRFIIHAGTTVVKANDGSTSTDITGTAPTGTADARWTGGTLGGVFVCNNGVDAPMYWGGNTALNLATLTAWPASTTCAVLKPWKNYLFALDVTKSGTRYAHMVKWSSAAEPGTLPASWDETNPANDAGEIDLSETTDFIVDALPLGDSLIIYKQASAYAMTYIGGQYIFAQRRLPVDCGMLARGCGAIVPNGHVILTAGDLVLFNGFEARSIATNRVRQWIFDAIDSTYYSRAFLVANPAFSEVWVCFPTAGNSACNRAVVWNYAEDTFSVRDLNNATCGVSGIIPSTIDNTIDADTATIDSDVTAIDYVEGATNKNQALIATSTPDVRLVDSGSDFNGTAFTASIERTGMALGDQTRVKTIRSVYPRIEGPAGQTMYVQIGATMDVETPYSWSDPITYTIGTTYKADAMFSGRFLAYRIWSESSFAWRLKSVDIDYTVRGIY